MNIRDGTERKVSFNARDELGDKIDKLTVMMSRLVAKDSYEKRPFKAQIYKSRGQGRSYNQEVTRIEVEDNMGTIDLDKTIETITFEETPEGMEDKIREE